jgi:hypothetical protein
VELLNVKQHQDANDSLGLSMRNGFYIILLLLFYSCKTPRYIYSPSAPNNPYFTEKGQTKLSGYFSSGGDDNSLAGEKNNGFDLQAAHSIADNWALTASYYNRKEKDVYPYKGHNFFDSSAVYYQRNLTEIGGGYFMMLSPPNGSYFRNGATITFNVYVGAGIGKFSIRDNGRDTSGLVYSRYHNSNVTKWFIQPSFNFITGKYFRFSLIDKISFIHYGNISTSYTAVELNYFELDRLSGRTVNFFEPSFNMQIGIPRLDWLKIDGGFTFTSGLGLKDAPNLKSRCFNASIGISFDFSANKKAPRK